MPRPTNAQPRTAVNACRADDDDREQNEPCPAGDLLDPVVTGSGQVAEYRHAGAPQRAAGHVLGQDTG